MTGQHVTLKWFECRLRTKCWFKGCCLFLGLYLYHCSIFYLNSEFVTYQIWINWTLVILKLCKHSRLFLGSFITAYVTRWCEIFGTAKDNGNGHFELYTCRLDLMITRLTLTTQLLSDDAALAPDRSVLPRLIDLDIKHSKPRSSAKFHHIEAYRGLKPFLHNYRLQRIFVSVIVQFLKLWDFLFCIVS